MEYDGEWKVEAAKRHAASVSYLLGRILKIYQLPGIARASRNQGMAYYGTRNQARLLMLGCYYSEINTLTAFQVRLSHICHLYPFR